MTIEVRFTNPGFWNLVAAQEEKLLKDESLYYVLLDHAFSMKPIVRTDEEFFTETLKRKGKNMKVCVNGPFYDVDPPGKRDAFLGHDPIDPVETAILGKVVEDGRRIVGESKPRMFYFGQFKEPAIFPFGDARDRHCKAPSGNGRGWSYHAGFGDPPESINTRCAIGGAGPIIVGALRHGAGNIYKPGKTGPAKGDPGPAGRTNLIQRNNETFKDADTKPKATGKVFLASHSGRRKLLVGVQKHGDPPGQTYTELAWDLLNLGFDHAVFLDGSDSATLMFEGEIKVTPGENKDETNILGIGFLRE